MGNQHSLSVPASSIQQCTEKQMRHQSLCVVIPVLNEEENIRAAIESVADGGGLHQGQDHSTPYASIAAPQIVVVDGGSHDRTVAIATSCGAKVIQTTRGRGHQMNVGWRSMECDWYLFLHGDSRLPHGYRAALAPILHPIEPHDTSSSASSSLPSSFSPSSSQPAQQHGGSAASGSQAQPYSTQLSQASPTTTTPSSGSRSAQSISSSAQGSNPSAWSPWPWKQTGKRSPAQPRWGCFSTICTEFRGSLQGAVLSKGVEARTRLLGQPYGDQALFVERSLLEEVGGFKEWPLLEDVALVKHLKRVTRTPPAIVPLPVHTSGRRWERLGFWRNAALNQAILVGWALGVDVDTLAAWYYPARKQLSRP